MPLPQEPVTIHGGCNCSAIRYRISIPAFEERPLHFSFQPETAKDPKTARLPLICTDHCNDCRTATASILPAWILTPQAMYTISCLPSTPTAQDSITFNKGALVPRGHADTESSTRPPFGPAHDLLRGATSSEGTWLRVYASTDANNPEVLIKRVVRSFCGRCGTNLTYLVDPMPFGFPDMIDVVLGTVDRADLEQEWMQPERQLWWSCGIPWVQEAVAGLPGQKHPIYSPVDVIASDEDKTGGLS